ncbi:ABC transporter ATP-binding protein [Hathewaya histolytica]|nr:ABC transporter ATP-binding protein [Hathewaya histolytica]
MTYHTLKGETSALKNINFKVNEGEFISIIGPSGCGKSTVLNIISGLIHPTSGNVYIGTNKIEKPTNSIGYMFQKDHLFPWLTVWDNVCLGLKIKNKLDDSSVDYITNLLKKYDLWGFKDFFPSELSGGMRQRAALIRTLALNPKVLLLDEPFSALDYQTRLNISDEIYEIIKRENKTTIMVTHDIAEAISMSDRLILLTPRPATINKNLEIKFDNKYNTPLKRREAPNFSTYFNLFWKELNSYE